MASSGITINGGKLREARLRKRWSTRLLADKLGCEPGHVRLMERNIRRPSISMLGKIEEVLEVSAKDLGAVDIPD